MLSLATLVTILREEIAGGSARQCDLLMLSQLYGCGGFPWSLSESHQWAAWDPTLSHAPCREVSDHMLKHRWPRPFCSWQSTGRQRLCLPDKCSVGWSARKAGLPHHTYQDAGMDLMLPWTQITQSW